MKLGKVEGTPQEIRDFFEGSELQLADYLQKPEDPLANRWLIVPAALLVTMLGLVYFAASFPVPKLVLPFFLLGACAVLWLSISIQLRFQSGLATTVAGVGGLLLLLIAAGYIGPKESLDALKELKQR